MGQFVAKNLTAEFYERGFADSWGPELVVGIFDKNTGEFHGGFVGDNTSLCSADNRVWNGGIRLVTNPAWLRKSPLEQLQLLFSNLARPMTLKLIGGCFPRDEVLPFPVWMGGKAMMVRGAFSGSREDFIYEWTRAMSTFMLSDDRPLLGGWYIGGADAGVDEIDLARICEANGSNRCVTGGPGYFQYEKEGATGRILLHAAKILVEELGLEWGSNLRLGIWGFGNVGKGVATWLLDEQYRGPRIVAVSNKSKPREKGIFTLTHGGIDPAALLHAAEDHECGISSLVSSTISPYTPGDELSLTYLDALFLAVPVERVINEKNAHSVGARMVLSGTNSGITEEAYGILHDCRVLAPSDFRANMGAASAAKSSLHGLSDSACMELAVRAIEKNLRWDILESRKTGLSLDAVARVDVCSRLGPPRPIF